MVAPISGAFATHSATGLASRVTAVPATPTRTTPSTTAVTHGEMPDLAARLTSGASVVPITKAVRIGSRMGRQKYRPAPNSNRKMPIVATCAADAQMSSTLSTGFGSLMISA